MAPQASPGRGLSLAAGILLELGAAGLGEMAVPIVTLCATRHLAVPPGCHVRAGCLVARARHELGLRCGQPRADPNTSHGAVGAGEGEGSAFPRAGQRFISTI